MILTVETVSERINACRSLFGRVISGAGPLAMRGRTYHVPDFERSPTDAPGRERTRAWKSLYQIVVFPLSGRVLTTAV